MEKKYILFSFVGFTDPINSYYDGAVLHIIRHYKPEKVFLYQSEKVRERNLKEDGLNKSLMDLQNRKVVDFEYHIIDKRLEDPSDYDAYHFIEDDLRELSKAYPNHTILGNISSGTPQMCVAIAICIQSLKTEFPNLKTVQVKAPEGGNVPARNYKDKEEPTIEEMILDNFDNDPNEPNRTKEPRLLTIKKTYIANLVKEYQYRSVNLLLDSYGFDEYGMASILSRHADLRLNFEYAQSIELLKKFPTVQDALSGYSNKQKNEVIEYFMILDILFYQNKLSEYILRLHPLIVELQKKYITKVLEFRLNNFMHINDNREVLNTKNLKDKYPDIFNRIQRNRRYNPHREPELNIFWLNNLIEGIVDPQGNKHNLNDEYIDDFRKLETINRDIRNVLAHQLSGISEEKLESDPRVRNHFKGTKNLHKRIKTIIQSLYELDDGDFEVYNNINDLIIENLK